MLFVYVAKPSLNKVYILFLASYRIMGYSEKKRIKQN